MSKKILKEVVGSQDQVAAAYGGFNKIIFKSNGIFEVHPLRIKFKIKEELNKNLLLVYSGLSRNAHDIASSYVEKLKKNKRNHILQIMNLVNESEKVLKNGDLNTFGELLHESWLEKKCLSSSISSSKIDTIYNDAIRKGAIGGKLLGAGGGGFFLFYVPPSKQKKFIQYFKKLIHIPFKFSQEGSKIILRTN